MSDIMSQGTGKAAPWPRARGNGDARTTAGVSSSIPGQNMPRGIGGCARDGVSTRLLAQGLARLAHFATHTPLCAERLHQRCEGHREGKFPPTSQVFL